VHRVWYVVCTLDFLRPCSNWKMLPLSAKAFMLKHSAYRFGFLFCVVRVRRDALTIHTAIDIKGPLCI
jgi:hypothetical protein